MTAARTRLEDTRSAVTHEFVVDGDKGYVTVGEYEDGTPGEIFIHMDKEGSTLSGFADAWAVMASVSLQYGVPISAIVAKFKHTRFEPQGLTDRPDIRPMATSVLDYVAHWLEKRYCDNDD